MRATLALFFFSLAIFTLAKQLCKRSMNAAQLLAAAQRANNDDIAEECLKMCTQNAPDDHTCFIALGKHLTSRGRFSEAHTALFRAVQLHTDADTWEIFRLSYVLEGRPEHMYVDLGALQLKNALDGPIHNVALLSDAVTYLERALALNPSCVEAHTHLYQIYTNYIPDPMKAALHFAHIDTDSSPVAAYTKGTQYFAKSDFENALKQFERAVQLSPTLGPAVANRFYLRKRVCEWGNFNHELKQIQDLIKREVQANSQNGTSVHPYMAISYNINPKLKLKLAQQFAKRERNSALQMGLSVFSHSPRRRAHRRLRIGYISTDFRLKATAYLIQHMFQHHDRNQFQIFCLALTADDGSLWRKLISSQCENFIDVSKNSPHTIVSLIHDKYEIDILIDMDGYCNEGIRKTEILAVQPAPIQIHLLVYPGTMGANYIQYFVGDPHTTPPSMYNLFHEKLIVMPHSYFVNSHRNLFDSSQALHGQQNVNGNSLKFEEHLENGVVVNAYGESRASFGLHDDLFVFCSFNSHYKFDPELWDIWMSLLRAVPNSVLWILRFPPESEPRLRREAAKRGVDADDQIVWSEFINDPEKNLRRLRFADVVLDTFHYGAHTGCADALFAGVPIVTLAGEQFAARVCTGQLRVVGLPHLVANSTQEYSELALRLAKNRDFWTATRTHLDKVRGTTPLFDTAGWVGSFERGLKAAWTRFSNNQDPDHILL